MTNISLPRLMDRTFREVSRPKPLSLSIEMNLRGLSTAAMTLSGLPAVEVGDFLELFTQQGSAGIFRVEQTEQDYPASTRLSLKHSLITLADSRCVLAQPGQAQPAPQLFRDILDQQSLWQCGDVEAPDTCLVTPEGGGSLLEALESLMTSLPDYRLVCVQSSAAWKVHLRKLSDECTTECRLTRNLSSLRLETDRSRLCTQLYLPGMEEPLLADTAQRWGIISAQLSASSRLSEEELMTLGRQYLDQHKNPQVTITMEALDLCRLTGAALDFFRLGGLCRVCLPESGTPLLQRIVSLSWPDVYATPDVIHVSLSTTVKNASTLLSGLVVDNTRVKKQVVRQWDELDLQKELLLAAQEQITLMSKDILLNAAEVITLRSGMDANAAEITLMNDRITANADAILLKADQASLELTNERIDMQASQISLKADQASLDLANERIDMQASQISLKADQASLDLANDRIDMQASEISLKADQSSLDLANERIDMQAGQISLKADKIDLEGFVTAEDLEAEVMSIMSDADIQGNLWVEGTLNAMYIQVTELYGDVIAESVTVGGEPAATQAWVSERGYATQKWVENKAYATQTEVTTTVNAVYNWVLENFATKIWTEANFQPKA